MEVSYAILKTTTLCLRGSHSLFGLHINFFRMLAAAITHEDANPEYITLDGFKAVYPRVFLWPRNFVYTVVQ
jgi:hypothetical protein